MGIVITVTSGKGGTGKTSITGGVAACLAESGRKVLCIDMDIGLRNLDIALGLNDRALMDFSDVALGRCPLARAAVEHPDIKGLSLLSSPMSLPANLSTDSVRSMLRTARELYDYIFIDSPAGLGTGFHLATCDCDRVLVVATNDTTSLRDAQRTVLQLDHIPTVHLIMNRIQPELLRKLRTTIDDAMNTAGLPLIGVVPEDVHVMLCANQGQPLISRGKRGAAMACSNIAHRLEGYPVPIMRIRKHGHY